MKVVAYRIWEEGTVQLADVLAHLAELDLAARILEVDGQRLRLEEAAHRNGRWLFDIGGIRHQGPGRASASTPISDFDLTDDEGFGHETAGCFDGQFLVLQYNHYGPRVARIREYFSRQGIRLAALAATDVEQVFGFIPVLKNDARERFDRAGIVKNLEIEFYVPDAIAGEGPSRQSLSGFLSSPLLATAEKLRIQISAGRGKSGSLALEHVNNVIEDLFGIREDISELNLTVKETEDSPREPIDLLNARLDVDVHVAQNGRRYGRTERWAALDQMLTAWRDSGALR